VQGISSSDQRLLHNGKELYPAALLTTAEHHHCTIHLGLRLLGGVKNKKKKSNKKQTGAALKRELLFAEPGQVYAQVTSLLGDSRLQATLSDGRKLLCKIRGTMRKRVYVNLGDMVLVCTRDFEERIGTSDRGDVIHKYTADEAMSLRAYHEIEPGFGVPGRPGALRDTTGSGEDGIHFGYDSDSDDTSFDIEAAIADV